jgi:DNA-binding transcriptional LysR family regulator
MSLLVNEFKKVHKERILIGAIPVLSYYGIMDIIAAYEKQYQNMKIEITETDTTPIFKMLNESEIDIGIIRTDELQHTCYDVMPICDDELVLLVGRRHRLADRRIVSLEETAEDEFLFFNTDSFLLKYYEKLFKHAGVSPKVQYSHMRLITIFSFIKQNKVVTLIMKRLAESYHDPMLRLVPLTNHPISSLSLVTRKNDVSQFGENFIKYLMNCKTKQAKLLKKG